MNFKKAIGIFSLVVLIVGIFMTFSACQSNNNKDEKSTIKNSGEKSTTQELNKTTFQKISQQEAKMLMDTESDYVILDVRTKQEYDEGHIENAILIPDCEISQRAQDILKDKNQLILVYCRSGRRSKLASQELADLGYTNVKEFGGIGTWKYGTVK